MMQITIQKERGHRKARVRDPALEGIVPLRPPKVPSGPMSMMEFAAQSSRTLEIHLKGRVDVLKELMGTDEKANAGSAVVKIGMERYLLAVKLARYVFRHTVDNCGRLEFPGIEMLSGLRDAISIDAAGSAASIYRDHRLVRLQRDVDKELENRIAIACACW